MSAATSCCGNTCTRAHDCSCSHARYDPLFTMSDNTRTIDTSTGANKCSHGRDVSADWWSQSGSNRRPHACKARALPAELWPLTWRASLQQCRSRPKTSAPLSSPAARRIMVGLGRFELPTSRLSSARSNQLSYRPGKRECCVHAKEEKRRRRCPANGRHRFETMHPDVSKRSDRNA